MTAFLTEYWLEALLAVSGAVTVVGLLINQIHLNKTLQLAIKSANEIFAEHLGKIQLIDARQQGIYKWGMELSKDFTDLKSRLDLLDKPSNEKALAELKTFVDNARSEMNRLYGVFQSHTKLIALLESSNSALAHKVKKLFDKKTLPKKPISKAPIATSKPRRKANGVGHAAR